MSGEFCSVPLPDGLPRMKWTWVTDFPEVLQKMYQLDSLCDVDFVVQGEKFPAHRCYLSACSPVLEALLTNGMKESRQRDVVLSDLKANIWERVLKFLYGFEIKVYSIVEALEMLECAHLFQLEDMESFIIDEICSEDVVNNENLVRAFVAHTNRPLTPELKSRFFGNLVQTRFLDASIIEVISSLEVMEEISRLPRLVCQGEIDILDRILERFRTQSWGKGQDSQDVKACILSSINVKKLSEKDLRHAIHKCDGILSQSSVRDFQYFCSTQLEKKMMIFKSSTPIPYKKRPQLSRNARMFSFKDRIDESFSENNLLKTKQYVDTWKDVSYWIEMRMLETGDVEVCLFFSDICSVQEYQIFALDVNEQETLYVSPDSSFFGGYLYQSSPYYTTPKLEIKLNEWNRIFHKDSKCIVVGATIYY